LLWPPVMTQHVLEAHVPFVQAPERAVAVPAVAKTPALALLVAICLADLTVLVTMLTIGVMRGIL